MPWQVSFLIGCALLSLSLFLHFLAPLVTH